MPLQIPAIDNRTYLDLMNAARARIPVHNPEWTNYQESDPGITLIELSAFLIENLLYSSNLIPERNRLKFLSLLGVPLQAASSAQGLVTFTNERGPLQTITLNDELEVRAGEVPFRTQQGLDVLPVEAQVYYKHKVANPAPNLQAYYQQLYASYSGGSSGATTPLLYETLPFSPRGTTPIDLGKETIDGSLWIALLLRAADKGRMDEAREAIGGKTISLGVVPAVADAGRQLLPAGLANPESLALLQYQMPNVPEGGALPSNPALRVPSYQALDASATTNVLASPGIVQITLPAAEKLILWNNLDPLESGVGDFPPALDDTTLNERLITWLRISAPTSAQVGLLWVGINTAFVTQRAHVSNELLPPGSGEPDQVAVLSKTPLIPGSVQLSVTFNGTTEVWEEIDDLLSAGPEVPVPDLRQPPGAPPTSNPLLKVKVFAVDAESGRLRFGDGTHGARPPFGAILRADYDYGVGSSGNVGPGSINSSPTLPAGLKVNNPVRTWGGAEAETVSEGEKQIARYLQHRDRLVNATDFETITLRTPGVDIGRVDVLPAFTPELPQNEPGDAPGAVTLMIIPKYDLDHPDAPEPDQLFLDTICDYLDSRRLVTTEVFLRGPTYKPIWVSVGINVIAGASIAQVREAVKQALSGFLSPLPPTPAAVLDAQAALLTTPQYASMQKGWPLRKPVVELELLAVASRVPGVLLVNKVLLAEGDNDAVPQVTMSGLELPQLVGISVAIGDPVDLKQLRGQITPQTTQNVVPVPIIPEECR